MAILSNDVYSAVEPTAQSLGVPDKLWETIANMESGFNPGSVGDNGTSFGLFQLHIGGQANAAIQAGYSTSDLLNPAINAKFGLPAIADSWNKLKGSFDDSLGWWSNFAAISGHPGAGSNTGSVAQSLKALYDAGGGGTQLMLDGTISTYTPTSVTSVSTPSSDSISQSIANMGSIILFFVIAIALFAISVVLLH